jgi:DNA-binding NtrC family response regulator
LIDIKILDIDGTDLLLKLPKNQEMVKIIITGFSTPEDGVKAADCGADEFLAKPVEQNFPQTLPRKQARQITLPLSLLAEIIKNYRKIKRRQKAEDSL